MDNKTKMITHILPAKDLYDERNDIIIRFQISHFLQRYWLP